MSLPEFTATIKDKELDNVQLIHELWTTNLSVKEKVLLSLEVYDLEPTYSVLTNMWLDYICSNEANKDCNKLIFDKYQTELSDSSKNLEGTTEYSLYFDIFEDPARNRDAWNYFLNNNPSDRFIKIMLALDSVMTSYSAIYVLPCINKKPGNHHEISVYCYVIAYWSYHCLRR